MMMPYSFDILSDLHDRSRASEQVVYMTNQYNNVVTRQPAKSKLSRLSMMFDQLKKNYIKMNQQQIVHRLWFLLPQIHLF